MKKLLVLLCCMSLLLSGCGSTNLPQAANDSVYAQESQWAYLETEATDTKTDVFFICPTVFMGENGETNWSEYDEETKASFVGATNMEKGIYDSDARFFAPYYHQASFSSYYAGDEISEQARTDAYKEVREAFLYYMKNYNDGRPLILAGFSQGADMSIRLMKDFAGYDTLQQQLIACYAIGWRITEQEMKEYPALHFAEGETDTGVIIAYNSEAETITDSMLVPKDYKTLAINPLNWRTDGTPADKSLNLGACFTDYDGKITEEIPSLTGAYLDETRGTLKVPDVNVTDYPGVLFDDGVYHLYDYQFFYRNLQKNVQDRTEAFLEK